MTVLLNQCFHLHSKDKQKSILSCPLY